jgi:hypothetical protein
MTERQEAEFLYAKGLEIAIMLKGPIKKNIKEGSVIKLIEDEYDAIAGRIAGKLFVSAKEMIEKKLL